MGGLGLRSEADAAAERRAIDRLNSLSARIACERRAKLASSRHPAFEEATFPAS